MLIEMLSSQSGVGLERLAELASSASRRYKVYEIPKKTDGSRTIEHPSRELKAIQRWIIKTVFDRLPIHECATAYKKGASIALNASQHRLTNYTTRYDFIGFFPSFRQERISSFLVEKNKEMNLGLTNDDISFVGDIVCRRGRLTIGAPSSPAISNVMMQKFDEQFHEHCSKRNIIFTRYADDIFVSTKAPKSLDGLENEIRRINRSIDYLALRINHKKTAHLSRKYARRVTGVIITPDRKLSIGRDRKREIKSLVHKWTTGNLESNRLSYLQGLLSFAFDVEPEFEQRLTRKYGEGVVDRIKSSGQSIPQF